MKQLPHDHENIAPTVLYIDEAIEYLKELISLAKTGEYDAYEICEAFCELIQVRLGLYSFYTLEEKYFLDVFELLTSAHPESYNRLILLKNIS